MRTKNYLLLVLFIFLCQTTFSQVFNKREAEEKYWSYRDRLNREFVVVGDGPGESIPAHNIDYSFYQDSEQGDGDLSNDRTTKARGEIQFGDGGINLGWYIGMLATELKLLKDSGMPYDDTKRELYFALKAYERIDKAGDLNRCINNPDGANEMNGFFIRDDVNGTFFNNHPQFSQRFKKEDGTYNYRSDDRRTCGSRMRFFLSPDQVASLYLGFALVKKCVLSSESYNGTSLRTLAINSAKSIADHYARWFWQGVGPTGERNIEFDMAFLFEFEAVEFAGSADWIANSNIYEKSLKSTLGAQLFGASILGWRKKFNIREGLEIPGASLGFHKAWKKGHDFVIGHNAIFGAIAGNLGGTDNGPKTRERLADVGLKYSSEIYPILHAFLNDQPFLGSPLGDFDLDDGASIISNMENALASAPCEGPHHYNREAPNNGGVHGWRGANRWIRAKKAKSGGWPGDYNNGDFNGLDYMVAHNLYLLYQNQFHEDFNDKIAGPSDICGSSIETYKLTSIPLVVNGHGETSVKWTVSPNLELLEESTSQIKVKVKNSLVSSNTAWVTVKVAYPCGGYTAHKVIATGQPSVQVISQGGPYSYSLYVIPAQNSSRLDDQGVTSVSWQKISSSGTVRIVDTDQPIAHVFGSNQPWSMSVRATVVNTCGTKIVHHNLSYQGGGGPGDEDPFTGGVSGFQGASFGGEADQAGVDLQVNSGVITSNNLLIKTQTQDWIEVSNLNKFETQTSEEVRGLELYNLSGSSIEKSDGKVIHIGGLKHGIYILMVELDSRVVSEKIIIN